MKNVQEEYIKVHVSLPHQWMIAGESMFATQLSNGHYRIENIPFFCYGLNLHDVVSVTICNEKIPEIEKLVKPSGNSTIRIFFNDSLKDAEILEYLSMLKGKGCCTERGNFYFFAVSVPKSCDYDRLFDELVDLEEKNILSFETGESRVEGSFDDAPHLND